MKYIEVLDTTLRDGTQGEGINFTVRDKLKIAEKLDVLGISYIEAGNPGSNPKDLEFFKEAKEKLKLKNAKICAFGSTHKPKELPENDKGIKSLLEAETEIVVIFGKSWDLHVFDVLKTTLDENLNIITSTIKYLVGKGKTVFFDAEHFFDGYKANSDYAISVIKTAQNAGASRVVLCDTNGACMMSEISDIVKCVKENITVPIGIHCHNDVGLATANTITAVEMGVTHVQGTINGIGERCGNANLCTIIPNLQLKLSYKCIGEDQIKLLFQTAKYVSELANVSHDEHQPYVGAYAFAHKGGMHIDGVLKNSSTFEHIPPEIVGNERKILISEMSGRSTILTKINEVDPTITKDSPKTKAVLEKLKEMEYKGYEYEAAESSLELLIRKTLGLYKPFFNLETFKTIVTEPSNGEFSGSAIIKIKVDGIEEITAADGDGPVNALDKSLRKALEKFYPKIKEMWLCDYKVRVLDNATDARTRVLIESTDGINNWSTVGVSRDIIDASWKALVDSIEYKLMIDERK